MIQFQLFSFLEAFAGVELQQLGSANAFAILLAVRVPFFSNIQAAFLNCTWGSMPLTSLFRSGTFLLALGIAKFGSCLLVLEAGPSFAVSVRVWVPVCQAGGRFTFRGHLLGTFFALKKFSLLGATWEQLQRPPSYAKLRSSAEVHCTGLGHREIGIAFFRGEFLYAR